MKPRSGAEKPVTLKCPHCGYVCSSQWAATLKKHPYCPGCYRDLSKPTPARHRIGRQTR